jgi:hypothetical protein
MADQFFVGRHNKKFGPFSATQLRELADSGRLQVADTVWKEGMEKPVLTSRVKNLFSPPAPPAAIPPEPAPAPAEVPEAPAEAVTVQPVPVPAAGPPAPTPPVNKPEQPRKRRAIAVKGATLISQDGVTVYYRKKCVKCGHEDTSRSSMHIGQGTIRVHFFCPKCRKNHEVQLQGMMQ